MKHEEHDIFENLFKELKINFTSANQKSVAKLLKTMSVDEVKNYLEETYKNRNTEVIDFSRERRFYFAIVKVMN